MPDWTADEDRHMADYRGEGPDDTPAPEPEAPVPPLKCEYLGLLPHGCLDPAIGRLYGTGGETGPLACWPCARAALDFEDGYRGWLPLTIMLALRAARAR